MDFFFVVINIFCFEILRFFMYLVLQIQSDDYFQICVIGRDFLFNCVYLIYYLTMIVFFILIEVR